MLEGTVGLGVDGLDMILGRVLDSEGNAVEGSVSMQGGRESAVRSDNV